MLCFLIGCFFLIYPKYFAQKKLKQEMADYLRLLIL